MKLVDTRIRVEASEYKTEYYPEYCLEWRTWYGKMKQQWFGVDSSTIRHKFGEAYAHANRSPDPQYSLAWAQLVIDTQAYYYKKHLEFNLHQNTKEVSYVKYP
jgi:hypothetical protein